MVTKERVNEALPDPNSVVMFEYMESLYKAGVLLAQQRHSHRSGQQHALMGTCRPTGSVKETRVGLYFTASEEGLLRRRTFELMDGRALLEEVAHKLVVEFPKRFSSWQQALSYAGVVSQAYSR